MAKPTTSEQNDGSGCCPNYTMHRVELGSSPCRLVRHGMTLPGYLETVRAIKDASMTARTYKDGHVYVAYNPETSRLETGRNEQAWKDSKVLVRVPCGDKAPCKRNNGAAELIAMAAIDKYRRGMA